MQAKGQDAFVQAPQWYVRRIEDNLIEQVPIPKILSDLGAGAGRELNQKICAAYSSAALAANAFGPWYERLDGMVLANVGQFQKMTFEAKVETGLRGTPPHLDVLLDGPVAVGVESKCLETLHAPKPKFSAAYDTIRDERASSKWFKMITELRTGQRVFRSLDAAQLIKHALGLQRSYKTSSAILLYLFWEPSNASDLEMFRRHRGELDDLADVVRGEQVAFSWGTYADLWRSWETTGTPWLRAHVERLKRRYQVAI